MAMPELSGVRAIVLGAETTAGRALATALAGAGARFAVVAALSDAAVAFDVQRLSRRIGADSQAINATNEMAVRVMTRQVSKELGGLDLLAFCADLGKSTASALTLAARFAAREMSRGGGGVILLAPPHGARADVAALAAEHSPAGVHVLTVEVPPEPDEAWAREALSRLPAAHGAADSP